MARTVARSTSDAVNQDNAPVVFGKLKKWKHRAKIAAIVAGVVAAFYLVLVIFVISGRLDRRIQRALSDAAGGEVYFNGLSMCGIFSIVMQGFVCEIPDQGVSFSAPNVQVAFSPFAWHSMGVGKISVADGFVLQYQTASSKENTGESQAVAPALLKIPWKWIPSLSLAGGRVQIEGKAGALVWHDVSGRMYAKTRMIIVSMQAALEKHAKQPAIKVQGNIYYERDGWMDLNVVLNNVDLSLLGQYGDALNKDNAWPSDIEGKVNSRLSVSGTLERPQVKGLLEAKNVIMQVKGQKIEGLDFAVEVEGALLEAVTLNPKITLDFKGRAGIEKLLASAQVNYQTRPGRMGTDRLEVRDFVVDWGSGNLVCEGVFSAQSSGHEISWHLRNMPVAAGAVFGLVPFFPDLEQWEYQGTIGAKGLLVNENGAWQSQMIFKGLGMTAISPDYQYGLDGIAVEGQMQAGADKLAIEKCRVTGGALVGGCYLDFSTRGLGVDLNILRQSEGDVSFAGRLKVDQIGKVEVSGDLNQTKDSAWDYQCDFALDRINAEKLYENYVRDVFADDFPSLKEIQISGSASAEGVVARQGKSSWLQGNIQLHEGGKFSISGLRIEECEGTIPVLLNLADAPLSDALLEAWESFGKIKARAVSLGEFLKIKDVQLHVGVVDNRLVVEPDLTFQFEGGGVVRVEGLKTGDLIKNPHGLVVDRITLTNVNLEHLTEKLEFGSVSGILNGEIRDLVLHAGQPEAFRAHFWTQKKRGIHQYVTNQAVRDLITVLVRNEQITSNLGRLGKDLLSKYGYESLDLSCGVENGYLWVQGKIQEDGEEYLLKGQGMKQLNIINANPGGAIRWRDFVAQYKIVVQRSKESKVVVE